MKIIDCEQGSEAWLRCRLGIPTASQANRLLTPAKLKPSSQAGDYRNQLLAEWLCQYPIDWGGASQFMDRGTELEPEARAFYAFQANVEVEQVGFLLRDDEMFGGSPDGLVGEDGILELKCPSLHVHIGYLLDPAALQAKYHGQVQALMYLSGRQWADLVAYNPDLPPVVLRIERDDAYIAALESVLEAFTAELLACRQTLEPHRAHFATRDPLPAGAAEAVVA